MTNVTSMLVYLFHSENGKILVFHKHNNLCFQLQRYNTERYEANFLEPSVDPLKLKICEERKQFDVETLNLTA